MSLSIEKINAMAAETAEKLAAEFPELPAENIRFWARFIAASSGTIISCQQRGIQPTGAGLEYIFKRCAELAASR